MLTYKQEDNTPPSEDTKVSDEEPIPPPTEEVTISAAEAAISPASPTNLGTDDLLVSSSNTLYSFIIYAYYLDFIYLLCAFF